jgi:hypothetical protein
MLYWNKLVELLLPYGVSESLLLWYFVVSRCYARSDILSIAIGQAMNKARYLRSRLYPISSGALFDAYSMPLPTCSSETHTFMHGAAAAANSEHSLTGRRGRTHSKLYVPADRRETFYYALYHKLREFASEELDGKPVRLHTISMTELRGADADCARWRLIMDVDINLPITNSTITVTQCEKHVAAMPAELRGWLAAIFTRSESNIWCEADVSPWRIKHTSDGVLVLRGGVHIYTNVIVDTTSAELVGIALREKMDLFPSVIELDPVSFALTPLRITGCHKIMRCPNLQSGHAKGLGDVHDCGLCFGKRCVTVSAPHRLPDDFGEWRRRLLYPLPEEAVWSLGEMHERLANVTRTEKKRRAGTELARAAVRHRAMHSNDALQQAALTFEATREIRSRLNSMFPAYRDAVGNVRVLSETIMVLSTDSVHCPFKQADHRASTLYSLFNRATRTIEIRCRHRRKPGDDAVPGNRCGTMPTPSLFLEVSDELQDLIFGPPDARERLRREARELFAAIENGSMII